MGNRDRDLAAIASNPVKLLDHPQEHGSLMAEMFKNVMKNNDFGDIVFKWPGEALKISDQIGLAARKSIDIDKAFQMVTATTQIQSQTWLNRCVIPTGWPPLRNSGRHHERFLGLEF